MVVEDTADQFIERVFKYFDESKSGQNQPLDYALVVKGALPMKHFLTLFLIMQDCVCMPPVQFESVTWSTSSDA